ncbi:glycosyl transferase family protein [Paenibacillus montaniterrae]|uniref:Glycosyl transferase family protein n=1 Tax=Paenibacillus montaniterrae TaxID=429341 RepID=A0A920CWB1_9BACL|nr:glycosyltransferase [Paenibacillus montaniterrae]GIP19102.1 glycosyl transferase family protein [Paenibacillus montaniterrae]
MQYSSLVTVSVIIPIHNGAEFIEQCLESVLKQKENIHEIIVVNDGSTDGTSDILKRYSDQIKIVSFNQKRGVSVSRNNGVILSQSDWILFLDADDILSDDFVKKYIFTLNKEPNDTILVYSKAIEITKEGNITNIIYEGFDMLNGTAFGHEIVRNRILLTGTMVKRDLFLNVGGFNETLTHGEDWDLWLRLSKYGAFKYASTTVVFIRRHESNSSAKLNRMLEAEKTIIKQYSLREIKYSISKRKLSELDNISDYLFLLLKIEEYKLCKDELNEYLNNSQQSDILLFVDALIHWNEQNWIQAKESLFLAISYKIKAEYHNNLGAIFLVEKEFDKAKTQFEAALSIHANYLDAAYNLDLAKSQTSDLKQIRITSRPLRKNLTSYSSF